MKLKNYLVQGVHIEYLETAIIEATSKREAEIMFHENIEKVLNVTSSDLELSAEPIYEMDCK